MKPAYVLVLIGAVIAGCTGPAEKLRRVSVVSSLPEADRIDLVAEMLPHLPMPNGLPEYDVRAAAKSYANDLYFFIPRDERVSWPSATVHGTFVGMQGAYQMSIEMLYDSGRWMLVRDPTITSTSCDLYRTRSSNIVESPGPHPGLAP